MAKTIFVVFFINILLIATINETSIAENAIRRALRETREAEENRPRNEQKPQKVFTIQEIVKILEEEDPLKSFSIKEIVDLLEKYNSI